MPGTATMGANLVDEMVLVADELRLLNGELGTRPWRVWRVVRTWAGGEPGADGGSVDVEVEITPTPLVRAQLRPWLERRQEPQGLEEAGVLIVEEVSLTYTAAELQPTLSAAQELLYKLTDAHGQGQAARYFTVVGVPQPDREDTIGWLMKLRRAEG